MRSPIAFPFTSVNRWLLVVVGCAVLATAQPMSAADDSATARKDDTIIYPKNAPSASSGTVEKSSSGPWLPISALLLAAAGGWVMWQKRMGTVRIGRGTQNLSVEETKSLGNRQFLIVAKYEDQRFLLGVTPGQIQLISKLEGSNSERAE